MKKAQHALVVAAVTVLFLFSGLNSIHPVNAQAASDLATS